MVRPDHSCGQLLFKEPGITGIGIIEHSLTFNETMILIKHGRRRRAPRRYRFRAPAVRRRASRRFNGAQRRTDALSANGGIGVHALDLAQVPAPDRGPMSLSAPMPTALPVAMRRATNTAVSSPAISSMIEPEIEFGRGERRKMRIERRNQFSSSRPDAAFQRQLRRP
jgi:hypothetical protein